MYNHDHDIQNRLIYKLKIDVTCYLKYINNSYEARLECNT